MQAKPVHCCSVSCSVRPDVLGLPASVGVVPFNFATAHATAVMAVVEGLLSAEAILYSLCASGIFAVLQNYVGFCPHLVMQNVWA
jgi:hypothetical protein